MTDNNHRFTEVKVVSKATPYKQNHHQTTSEQVSSCENITISPSTEYLDSNRMAGKTEAVQISTNNVTDDNGSPKTRTNT